MNHELDFDRDHNHEDLLENEPLKDFLKKTCETETELMRTYMITAERIHDNEELKLRLRNFAEGNAKRSRQLLDEISRLS
ncbi:hypothetical protein [Litchfieldia alkalitelluris]|uniref:hypothetical protein n=1 Tax=Litchfieldia alkalitelluris TaxID=304268 RepID=UPI000997F7ED|nr:hypothetical protein [Litchfieldia alkalitelluris]